MTKKYKINRFELSGSIADLGTLLPFGIGMVVVNKLNPTGIFLSVGLLYVITGWYYGVPTSVQPMKVVASYAIATAMTFQQIQAACILMVLFLLLIGLTGAIDFIEKYTPKSIVRGVQLTTGIILMIKGINFVFGTSTLQQIKGFAEPNLILQHIGIVPIGMVIGTVSFLIVLFLLDNRRVPAGIVVIVFGVIIGLLFGTKSQIAFTKLSISTLSFFSLNFPVSSDFISALVVLVIPQIPMTVGNAIIANKDLSITYFGFKARKVTNKSLCLTMALGNLFSIFLGGMPVCHGAGGLAAHYRFGARSGSSNLIIGFTFILLAFLFGDKIIQFFNVIPMATLGILLLFAGAQLTLTIMDVKNREDMFVVFIILAISLASNLGLGFMSGVVINSILKLGMVKI